MQINVSFMSGAGNLFSVIDNSIYNFNKEELSKLAVLLCNVNEYNQNKTEGFIAINEHPELGFDADFYNPDGSNDAMCGNGGRCAIRYALIKEFIEPGGEIKFSMAGSGYDGKNENDGISLILPPPNSMDFDGKLEINGKEISYTYIDVGAKHIVINYDSIGFSEELREHELIEFSRKIRYHESFAPHGANVNLFHVNPDNSIALRTYERGVEMETGACGTGAISAALSVHKLNNLTFPLKVIPPSLIPVLVDISGEFPDEIRSISLKGHAEITEEKTIEIPEL
jgi:diaminopimelate epimerase